MKVNASLINTDPNAVSTAEPQDASKQIYHRPQPKRHINLRSIELRHDKVCQ